MEEKRKDPQARILPSMPMPSEDDSHPQDVPPPAPQAAPSPYEKKKPLEFKEASGSDEQLTTPATQPPTESGDLSTGRILPPSQEIHSHSDESPPSQPPAPQAGPSSYDYNHTPLNFEPSSSVVYALQPRTGHPPMEPLEPGELNEGRILPSMPSQVRNSPDSSPEQPPTPHALMPPGFEQAPAYAGRPGPYPQPPLERGAMNAGGILPSMPTQGNDSPELPPEPPAPQTAPSIFAQLQSGFTMPTQGFMQQPLAAYSQTEQGGGLSAGGVIPSPSPPYSASATGTGSYSPMGGPSTVGMPPVSYHRYDSYQSTYYPYGANGSTPYSSHVAMGSQAGYAASQMQMMAAGGGSYAGVGAGGPMYGGAAQAYTHYGSGYPPPQQFPAPAPYDYHELSSRGQTRHQANRSYATRPGRPYFRDKSRSGPNGANLFVFHVPNEMTNEDMLRLFQPHGNVLSVRIMTERHTGRGKGYGFVSYDSVEAAENAIHFLNGFEIQGKRLKVQHKESKKRDDDSHNQGHRSSPSFAPVQEHSRPSRHHQHHQGQSPAASGFVPAHESVPVPEYSTPSRHHHHHQGRSPAASGFVPAHESVPVQDHSIPSWHHQHHQGQSPAASGFVPVHESVPGQEYAGPSEPDHRHELAPVLPPIEDDSRHCRTPTLPSVDEPHHRRQPTPTLPPIDALGEGSNPPDYEGAQGYTTPQSPLADLKDIGKSLPDPK